MLRWWFKKNDSCVCGHAWSSKVAVWVKLGGSHTPHRVL